MLESRNQGLVVLVGMKAGRAKDTSALTLPWIRGGMEEVRVHSIWDHRDAAAGDPEIPGQLSPQVFGIDDVMIRQRPQKPVVLSQWPSALAASGDDDWNLGQPPE
jgi:hypothetical protein